VFDDNGVRWVSSQLFVRFVLVSCHLGEKLTGTRGWHVVQTLPFTMDAELVIQTIHELQPSAKPQGVEPPSFRTNDLFDCVQNHITVPYEEDVTVRCVFVFGRSHQIPIVDSTHPLLHKPVRGCLANRFQ
jgi:hypothetical protein